MHEASGRMDKILIFHKAVEKRFRGAARTDQGGVSSADGIEEDIAPKDGVCT